MADSTNHFVFDMAPEVFSFSPLPRWYGLLFAGGIMLGYVLGRRLVTRDGRWHDGLDNLLVYIIVGTMVGMRLAHCLFYQPDVYLRDPLRILFIWEGGYASHGGFFGVICAIAVWAWRNKELKIDFWYLADRVAITAMFPASFIRLGNFFNSEMIGHQTDVSWAVVFARIDNIPRHPAQLYESIGYAGVLISSYLLYRFTRITDTRGRLMGYVITAAFCWRIFCEYFKLNQVAFEEGMVFNMGQILSMPFVVGGIALIANVQARIPRYGTMEVADDTPTTPSAAAPPKRNKPAKKKPKKRRKR